MASNIGADQQKLPSPPKPDKASIAQSILAGLMQEDPDAQDASNLSRAMSVGPDDYMLDPTPGLDQVHDEDERPDADDLEQQKKDYLAWEREDRDRYNSFGERIRNAGKIINVDSEPAPALNPDGSLKADEEPTPGQGEEKALLAEMAKQVQALGEVLKEHFFDESQHPRGQPENPGQFAEKPGGSAGSAKPAGSTATVPVSGNPPPPKPTGKPATGQSAAPAAAAPAAPAAPEPEPKKYGKSRAQVNVRMDEETVDARLGRFFEGLDPAAARQAVADVVGAPDDAEVFVYPDSWSDGLKVSIKHKDIKRCDRTMDIDADGTKFIHNDYLAVLTPGTGLGTDILARAVENAAANGFEYFETTAGGSHRNLDENGHFQKDKMGGYYVWPQIGYDSVFDDGWDPDVLDDISTNFPEAKTLRDVILAPGGLEWWKYHGEEVNQMKFDLSEGSMSRKMLARFINKKAAKNK